MLTLRADRLPLSWFWVGQGLISLYVAMIEVVAVHLGVKMADTLSFTAKVDMVNL